MIDSFRGEHRWLSNFWPCSVTLDGMTFSSVEHAYVAAKTLNMDIREEVRLLDSAGKAKKFGRSIELREDWNDVKDDVMLNLLKQKFSTRNPELMYKLIDTCNKELIEGNTWGDVYWGVCNGKGRNMLGKLLMKVREERRFAMMRSSRLIEWG